MIITAAGTPAGVRKYVVDALDGLDKTAQKLRSAAEELLEEMTDAKLVEVIISYNDIQENSAGVINAVSVRRMAYLS